MLEYDVLINKTNCKMIANFLKFIVFLMTFQWLCFCCHLFNDLLFLWIIFIEGSSQWANVSIWLNVLIWLITCIFWMVRCITGEANKDKYKALISDRAIQLNEVKSIEKVSTITTVNTLTGKQLWQDNGGQHYLPILFVNVLQWHLVIQ